MHTVKIRGWNSPSKFSDTTFDMPGIYVVQGLSKEYRVFFPLLLLYTRCSLKKTGEEDLPWQLELYSRQIEKKTIDFCRSSQLDANFVRSYVCFFDVMDRQTDRQTDRQRDSCLWVGSFYFLSRKISFSPFKHPEPTFVKLNLILSSPVLDTPCYKHIRYIHIRFVIAFALQD